MCGKPARDFRFASAVKACKSVLIDAYAEPSIQAFGINIGAQINAGDSLTETFQNLGIFPPLVIRMLRVGEATGALDTALLNVTYFYNRDVKESVDKGMALIGPVLTVFLGAMMVFIMWAVLGPVYDILGKIKF